MAKITTPLLASEFKEAHGFFLQTMEGVTNEIAAFMPPGKANPISGIFAHAVISEDFFIHMLLQGKQPLFLTTWKDKTGASEIQPTEWETAYPKWLKEVKVDVNQMKKYAEAVYASGEKYVATLSDEDLLKDIDVSSFGMGKRPLGSIFISMIYGHLRDLMGEISVLKGIQGLKGYPF
jgi:hypothetical protein